MKSVHREVCEKFAFYYNDICKIQSNTSLKTRNKVRCNIKNIVTINVHYLINLLYYNIREPF